MTTARFMLCSTTPMYISAAWLFGLWCGFARRRPSKRCTPRGRKMSGFWLGGPRARIALSNSARSGTGPTTPARTCASPRSNHRNLRQRQPMVFRGHSEATTGYGGSPTGFRLTSLHRLILPSGWTGRHRPSTRRSVCPATSCNGLARQLGGSGRRRPRAVTSGLASPRRVERLSPRCPSPCELTGHDVRRTRVERVTIV
jgi:hypothetical protein